MGVNRREFLAFAAAAGVAISLPKALAVAPPDTLYHVDAMVNSATLPPHLCAAMLSNLRFAGVKEETIFFYPAIHRIDFDTWMFRAEGIT